jgi:uncharacterized protein DUF4239
MDLIYESPSWILNSLIVVIPSILVCLVILWLMRKFIPHTVLQKNHDVAGFTLSIVGVLYSVILGFTVVNAQTRYNEAILNLHTEALTVADLYRDAGFFPEANRKEIRASLRNYVDYVVKEEWRLPEEKGLHLKTQDVMENIFLSYYGVVLSDEKMTSWYNVSIEKLNKLMDARLSRLFATQEHLGQMMWSLLISGALITIGFMFFFGLENLRSQMLMTALVAGYITFMLYLVYSLDNVFNGPEALKPTALEQVYTLFDRWDAK